MAEGVHPGLALAPLQVFHPDTGVEGHELGVGADGAHCELRKYGSIY
jgi:hypothetical protein